MAGKPIVISILANASNATQGLNQTATRAQKMGATVRRAALPAIAVLAGLGRAALSAGQAAAEDDAAASRLAQTLKTTTGATKSQVSATESWIAAQGKALGVTDDELRPALGKLATATGSITKSQKFASLAMNISASTGKSLESVTNSLAKSLSTGNVSALSKYGVATKDAEGNTRTLSDVTGELTKKYNGSAAKAADTVAGRQKRLQVQLGELQEQIGARLLPVLAKMAAFGLKAVEWIGKNESTVVKMVAAIAGLAAAVLVVNAAMKVASAVTAVYHGVLIVASGVTKAAAAAQWLLNVALTANPIGLVVVAIAALVAGLVIAYKNSETFRKIVNKAFGAIKAVVVPAISFVVNFVKNNWKLLPLLLLGPLGIAVVAIIKNWNKIKAATSAVWNAIKGVVSGVVNGIKGLISGQFNLMKSIITGAWNAAKSATSNVWNGIKTAVSNAVTGLMAIVAGIKSRVTGAFTGAASWLLNAGKDIIQGLLDGIESMIGSVTSKLNGLTDKIPDWKGPPAKDKVLLRGAGRLIIKGLVDGFTDGEAGVEKSLKAITARIAKYFDKKFKNDKQADAATKRALKGLKDEYAALTKNAKAQDKITDALEKARGKLADVKAEAASYATSIRESFTSFGSITSLGEGVGYANSDQMLSVLRAKVDQAKQYAAMVKSLIAKGLNKASIQQLLDAGVEGGYGAAQTLLAGGASVIKDVNGLTAQLAAAGQGLGNTAAQSMFGAGIKTAQGVVKGLEREEKRLDKVGARMGRALVREAAQILDARSAKQSQRQTITVKFSTDQVSQLQRGKDVMADIDVARSNGVKFRAA